MVEFVRSHVEDAPDTSGPSSPSVDVDSLTRRGGHPPTSDDGIADQVVALVADKTGYPADMLDLDLDLEADLGIDTVKQAETFAAIRELFDIPRQDELNLRDYPTLGDVVGFVRDHMPQDDPDPDPAPNRRSAQAGRRGTIVPLGVRPGGADTPQPDPTPLPRRVPVPVLRPPLDHCQPTGVTLDAHTRVLLVGDAGGVGRALTHRLEKRGVKVLLLEADPDRDRFAAALQVLLLDGPIHGVYWLPALDAEPPLPELSADAWQQLTAARVKNLFGALKILLAAGEPPFLVTGTRLGGLHGYGDEGATSLIGGAVVGLCKAYRREQPDAVVKVVDLPDGRRTAGPADLLLDETLSDPGVVEVGCRGGRRFSVGLDERPPTATTPPLDLGPDSVFVVTGAAGGITRAIVEDLARATGAAFHLLDLTPEPRRDDFDVALFRTDREQLKAELIGRMKESGDRPIPAVIERQLLAVERREAALGALEAVEAAGGAATWHALDLRDDEAVTTAIDAIRERHGRIDVLVHAAGLEISRPLADKPTEQFDLVFDVKADGLFHLLRASADMPLGALVAFSSVAGRFGNAGQTDYSAANDLLCKAAAGISRWRPGTRGLAIDWSAWADIGMATRGSIPAIMASAGIDLVPPEHGVPIVRRELVEGGDAREIVVGGSLGVLVEELCEHGGLDVQRAREQLAELPMLGEIVDAGLHGGLEIHTTLDPQAEPFLFDHEVEPGLAYLPGVMGIEAFAELAHLLAPDLALTAIERVAYHAPFKFYRREPRTLVLSASPRWVGGRLTVHTTLRSRTDRPGLPSQEKVHFTAEVVLGELACEPIVVPETRPGVDHVTVGREAIYDTYFHGPAYQVLREVDVDGDHAWGWAPDSLPADSSVEHGGWLAAPRLIELCFQAAGLWEMATRQTMALPASVERVDLHLPADHGGGVKLRAVVEAREDAFDVQVVGADGRVHVDVRGYRTVPIGQATLPLTEGANTRQAAARRV